MLPPEQPNAFGHGQLTQRREIVPAAATATASVSVVRTFASNWPRQIGGIGGGGGGGGAAGEVTQGIGFRQPPRQHLEHRW